MNSMIPSVMIHTEIDPKTIFFRQCPATIASIDVMPMERKRLSAKIAHFFILHYRLAHVSTSEWKIIIIFERNKVIRLWLFMRFFSLILEKLNFLDNDLCRVDLPTILLI